MMKKLIVAVAMYFVIISAAYAEDSGKISVTVRDEPVRSAFENIAKQSKEKILLESTVKGQVTLSINDVELESALEAICKASKCDWRKLHIKSDSSLLEQPDRLAATVRLMSGIGFLALPLQAKLEFTALTRSL